MRLTDIFSLSMEALSQQKLRTALTSLGVICGTFVLVISLSLRQGVQETILREISRFGDLRLIEVTSIYGAQETQASNKTVEPKGEMGPERRKRLKAELERRAAMQGPAFPTVPLTRQRLRELEALEHVKSVTPWGQHAVRAVLGGHAENASAMAALPGDDYFRHRLVAGSDLSGPGSRDLLVSEYLLYRLGIVDEAAVGGVLDRQLRLEFRNLSPIEWPNLLPEPPIAAEFTIRGVIRSAEDSESKGRWDFLRGRTDLVLPARTLEELMERLPWVRKHGLDSVLVEVDDSDHVKDVTQKVKALGLHGDAMIERVDVERFIYHMVFSGMSLVAAVALVVAALGIANTMLMGVLERMREIGVMKAVGARDSHIVAIFLVEGATIGLIGGGLGLGLAWGLSGPGDAWMQSILERNTSIRLHGSVFAFPLWLVVGAPAFACLTTTLAAVYPARRAARVDPVAALRHE